MPGHFETPEQRQECQLETCLQFERYCRRATACMPRMTRSLSPRKRENMNHVNSGVVQVIPSAISMVSIGMLLTNTAVGATRLVPGRARGLPRPVVNLPVRLPDGRLIFLDLAFPEAMVAVEYDGRHHSERGSGVLKR